jgi:hypothetical protein
MIPDIDIWRCANELIKEHGDEAGTAAAVLGDAFFEKGDLDGQRVWMRVAKAIDQLQRVESGASRN